MFYIILAAAAYLLYISVLFTTSTYLAFFLYKMLPTVLSLILAFHAVKGLGWLQFL